MKRYFVRLKDSDIRGPWTMNEIQELVDDGKLPTEIEVGQVSKSNSDESLFNTDWQPLPPPGWIYILGKARWLLLGTITVLGVALFFIISTIRAFNGDVSAFFQITFGVIVYVYFFVFPYLIVANYRSRDRT